MSKHDFTQLVADALKGCKEYNKYDWAQIRSDEIATYDVGEEAVEILKETVGADLEGHITNLEEVRANEKRCTEEYINHLKTCDKECCIALKNARIDIGVMEA